MKRTVEPETIHFVPWQNSLGLFLSEVRNGKTVHTHGPLKENEAISIQTAKLIEERAHNLSSGRLRKLSDKQERRIAKDVGGRVQPASGALPGAKGDVRKQGQLRIEAKFTYAKSYRLTMQVLDKIVGEAKHGELPVVQVDFLDKRSNQVLRSVIIVPYEDWVRKVQDESVNHP